MKYCEWCKSLDDELTEYTSQGTAISYNICGKCSKSMDEYKCIKCGGLIVGIDISGLCIDCAQEKTTEDQKIQNEIAEGVYYDIEHSQNNGSIFTEKDYESWVTMAQKPYSKDEIKRNRLTWLKLKLISTPEWTQERIDRNADAFSELIDKYSHNLVTHKYMIIYYPERPEQGEEFKRPEATIVDRIQDVILVEVK